jgi:hypothetical protein
MKESFSHEVYSLCLRDFVVKPAKHNQGPPWGDLGGFTLGGFRGHPKNTPL